MKGNFTVYRLSISSEGVTAYRLIMPGLSLLQIYDYGLMSNRIFRIGNYLNYVSKQNWIGDATMS